MFLTRVGATIGGGNVGFTHQRRQHVSSASDAMVERPDRVDYFGHLTSSGAGKAGPHIIWDERLLLRERTVCDNNQMK